MKRQLREESDAIHTADQPAWARLASAFHLRVAMLAGNRILQQYLAELVSRCSLIVALYEPPGDAACEHDEHARVVTLMERGDVAGAVALMNDHLADLERRIDLTRGNHAADLGRMLGL